MREKLGPPIRKIGKIIKTSSLQAEVGFCKAGLDFSRRLRSRESAVIFGFLSGLLGASGEWKGAVALTSFLILHKGVVEWNNIVEGRFERKIEREEERLEHLKPGPKVDK